MSAELYVIEKDWPHGLRCQDCDRKLREGDAYSKRLTGMNGDVPVVEIVCVLCGLGLAADR